METRLCLEHEIEALEAIESDLIEALDTNHQRLHPNSRTGHLVRSALVGLDVVIDSLYADLEFTAHCADQECDCD